MYELVFAATVTTNDCDVEVFVDGSVAVTVMVEVSPACAWVASTWITPSGLVVESVSELTTIGLTGNDLATTDRVCRQGHLGHLVDEVQARDDLAEDRVVEHEARVGGRLGGVRDEELGIVGVGLARVGHGELARVGERQICWTISLANGVPGRPLTPVLRLFGDPPWTMKPFASGNPLATRKMFLLL